MVIRPRSLGRVCVVVASIVPLAPFLTTGCALPFDSKTPVRTHALELGRVAAVVADGRLQLGELEPWFDSGGQLVYRLEVPGAEALAWWRFLRSQFETTGYWPILLGAPADAAIIDEMRAFDDIDPSDLDPRAVSAFDLAGWRSRAAAEYSEWGGEPRGIWPARVAESDFVVDVDILSGRLHPTVVVGLVPVDEGWQVPLVLRYGGWNACPPAMVHAATLRDWQHRFGAELVTMTGEIVELQVDDPPRNREAAMALAREQFLYCGDIVWQGTDDLETLAATVLEAPVWNFWWD